MSEARDLASARCLISVLAIVSLVCGALAAGRARPPPIPVYDGCVVESRVRIVTGSKRVIDREKQPVDLSKLAGKRIRFRGHLQREPTLVMLQSAPTVIGACRGPQRLPETGVALQTALRASRRARWWPESTANRLGAIRCL